MIVERSANGDAQAGADWRVAATIALLLRSEGAETDADAAYERALKAALHKGGADTRVSRDAIGTYVRDVLGIEFPLPLLHAAVDRLLQKREVVSIPGDGDLLALAPDCYAELEANQPRLEQLREAALESWLADVTERHPPLAEFRGELASLIEDYIVEAASFVALETRVTCEGDGDVVLPRVPGPSAQLLSQFPSELQDVVGGACRSFFEGADVARLAYIDALLDGYYELQLLRCTPEMQEVLVPQLQGTVCLLDTNVVLDVLGIAEEPCAVALARQAVELALALGIEVCVSEETRQEYLHLLVSAKNQLEAARSVAANGAGDAITPAPTSPLLCHFNRCLAERRDLTWREFEAEHLDLAALLARFRIAYAPDVMLADRKPIAELAGLFDEAAPGKTAHARQHDAVMYLIVRELRLETESGVRTWFLTRDYSLYAFDRAARARLPDPGLRMPSFAIRLHPWIGWLKSRAPARMPDGDPAVDFGRLLYDLQFATLDRDARVVGRQTVYLETYRDLDSDFIQSLDTDRLIEKELDALGGAEQATDQQVVDIVDRAVLERAEREHKEGRLKDDEIEKLKDRLSRVEEFVGGVLPFLTAVVASVLVALLWIALPLPWRWAVPIASLCGWVMVWLGHRKALWSKVLGVFRSRPWKVVLALAILLATKQFVQARVSTRYATLMASDVWDLALLGAALLLETGLRKTRKPAR